MLQKYHVIKSVDNEGRKVITYIKNNLYNSNNGSNNGKDNHKTQKEEYNTYPEALQVTVRLP